MYSVLLSFSLPEMKLKLNKSLDFKKKITSQFKNLVKLTTAHKKCLKLTLKINKMKI